jgi:hypothetical protein
MTPTKNIKRAAHRNGRGVAGAVVAAVARGIPLLEPRA